MLAKRRIVRLNIFDTVFNWIFNHFQVHGSPDSSGWEVDTGGISEPNLCKGLINDCFVEVNEAGGLNFEQVLG